MAKGKQKAKGFIKEFREFINRGNAFMLAIGVVIGGAFSAIVNAFVNMLMSVATWAVPGGLKGLVTVLPALNDAQKGIDESIGLGQKFAASDLQSIATAYAEKMYGSTDPLLIETAKGSIIGKYTLHGTTYTYNMSAVIDWGTLINAFLSFVIIAIVLFIIVKVVNSIQRKNEAIKAKALEEYYKKHPEERPAPVEPDAPAPTTEELLTQIRDLLAEKKK